VDPGTWLGFWLSTRRSIRPSTARTYRTHIDRYLVPALGHLRLAELTGRDTSPAAGPAPATPNIEHVVVVLLSIVVSLALAHRRQART